MIIARWLLRQADVSCLWKTGNSTLEGQLAEQEGTAILALYARRLNKHVMSVSEVDTKDEVSRHSVNRG